MLAICFKSYHFRLHPFALSICGREERERDKKGAQRVLHIPQDKLVLQILSRKWIWLGRGVGDEGARRLLGWQVP